MGQEKSRYEEWLHGYLARGERLRSLFRETFLTVRGTGVLALPELRAARASFPQKFCLFQYSSAYDQALAGNLLDQLGFRVTDEMQATNQEITAETARRALSTLMPVLDQMGTHLVVLERPNEEPPDGPLRLQSPDESWFPMFAQLAELAQAIILPAGIGPNVMHEIQYLHDAGLSRRIVLYIDNKLIQGDPDNPTVQELSSLSDVKKAIEMAAAQPPAPESAEFIREPKVPEWVMKNLEASPQKA